MMCQSALYIFAGVKHFREPEFFVGIMPPFLPYPLELVYITGVMEIILGLMFWVPNLRRITGYSVITFLFLVFPANIYCVWD